MHRFWVAMALSGIAAVGSPLSAAVEPRGSARQDASATIQRVNALMQATPVDWPRDAGRKKDAPAVPDSQSARAVLTEASQSEDVQTRIEALDGLAQNAPEEHLDTFVAALCDDAQQVREAAARILARLDPAAVFERTFALLATGDPETAARAYSALPMLKGCLEPGMIHVLQSVDAPATDKRVAAYSLGVMGSAAAVPALANATWNGDAELAGYGIQALASIHDPVVLPRLGELSGHPLPQVRSLALQAIASIGGIDAIMTLDRIALNPPQADAEIARQAVGLLGATKDVNVVPLLVEVMRTNVPARGAAVEALRQITGEDLGDRPTDWQEWFQNKLQRQPARRAVSRSSVFYFRFYPSPFWFWGWFSKP